MRWIFHLAPITCWLIAGALLWWRVNPVSGGFIVLGLVFEVAGWFFFAKARKASSNNCKD